MIEVARNPGIVVVEDWSTQQWRVLVETTARAYLSDDYDPMRPPRVADFAEDIYRKGIPPETPTLIKAERYSVAAAAIHAITDHMIIGEGVDAYYRNPIHEEAPVRLSNTVLERSISRTFNDGASSAHSKDWRLVAFLDRFDHLDQRDKASPHTSNFIMQGGTLPLEMASFTNLTAKKMEHYKLTQGMGEPDRIIVAHGLKALLRTRASLHRDIIDHTSWESQRLIDAQLETYRALPGPEGNAIRAIFRVVALDNNALWGLADSVQEAIEHDGTPILKCPAHQRLFKGAPTALDRQAHAAINMAGDMGYYHPDQQSPVKSPDYYL